MVSEKGLQVNNHGMTEIEIMSVVLHLLGEDVTRVDDARYVLQIDIFGMMAFTDHFSLRLRCLIPFDITEAAQCTHVLLSFCIVV